jgi:hypothetical protein
MLAYTKLAEPTAGIEMSQEDLDTWAARIDLYAIRSKRRVTQYEDEPAYAQFNHIMIPR